MLKFTCENYFRAHARCRRMIECSWALLKNRFLSLKNILRLKSPKKCGEVIMACAHLHNFIIETKEEGDDFLDIGLLGLEEEESEESDEDEEDAIDNPIIQNQFLKNVYNTFLSINRS